MASSQTARKTRARSPLKSGRDVDDLVPRNAHGGILVDESELKAAFSFFDSRGTGRITIADLKSRLSPFYKDMPMREFKFLMAGKTSLTLDDLRELVADNDLTGFDPVAEAFKVFDPSGSGIADEGVLRDVFRRLGFEELSDEDMDILLRTADVDGDGRVSREDFRRMLAAKPATDATGGGGGGGGK